MMIKTNPPTPITITAIAHCGTNLSSSSMYWGVVTLGITERELFLNKKSRCQFYKINTLSIT